MSDSGLPVSLRAFRYVLSYLNGADERVSNPSVLMTEGNANKEMLRLLAEGKATKDEIEVIVDKVAAARYQAALDEKAEAKKRAKGAMAR